MGEAPGPSDLRGLVGTLVADGFRMSVEVVDHRPPTGRANQSWHDILMRPLESSDAGLALAEPEAEPGRGEAQSEHGSQTATMPTQLDLHLEGPGWSGRYELGMSTERRAGVLCFNGRARLAESRRRALEPRFQHLRGSPSVTRLRRRLDRNLWQDHGAAWAELLAWLGRGDNPLPGRAALHRSLAIWLRGCSAPAGLRSDDLVDEFVAAKLDLRAALPEASRVRKYGLGASPWVMSAEWFGPFIVRLIVGAGQGQGAYSPAAFAELLRRLGPLGLLLTEARAFPVRRNLDLGGRPLELVHLAHFDLRGVVGRRARLRRAKLGGAWLDGVDLSGADLRGARMSRVLLGDTKLVGADLRDVRLREADLSEARLEGADLRGAYLGGVEFAGARLHGADLRGADLRGSTISGAQLRLAKVEGDWWDSQIE